jgi:hypothetical protein
MGILICKVILGVIASVVVFVTIVCILARLGTYGIGHDES